MGNTNKKVKEEYITTGDLNMNSMCSSNKDFWNDNIMDDKFNWDAKNNRDTKTNRDTKNNRDDKTNRDNRGDKMDVSKSKMLVPKQTKEIKVIETKSIPKSIEVKNKISWQFIYKYDNLKPISEPLSLINSHHEQTRSLRLQIQEWKSEQLIEAFHLSKDNPLAHTYTTGALADIIMRKYNIVSFVFANNWKGWYARASMIMHILNSLYGMPARVGEFQSILPIRQRCGLGDRIIGAIINVPIRFGILPNNNVTHGNRITAKNLTNVELIFTFIIGNIIYEDCNDVNDPNNFILELYKLGNVSVWYVRADGSKGAINKKK